MAAAERGARALHQRVHGLPEHRPAGRPGKLHATGAAVPRGAIHGARRVRGRGQLGASAEPVARAGGRIAIMTADPAPVIPASLADLVERPLIAHLATVRPDG